VNQNPNREFHLGPRPGAHIKSGVVVPEDKKLKTTDRPTPIVDTPTTATVEGDSDSELEIEPSAIPTNAD